MSNWLDYFRGKGVWITGASSGIGRGLAETLAKNDVRVLVSARRADVLDQLAETYATVQALAFDISDESVLAEVATRAWDLLAGIDVLINNAGVSQRARFAETDPTVISGLFATNLLGPTRLTREVVGRMVQQGHGHVVAMSSYVVRVPAPTRTVYAASKAALHGLFDSLRLEVAPQGVDVTLVLPGFVKTEMSESAMTASGENHGVLDARHAKGMSPERCANRILSGVAKRKRQFSVALAPILVLGSVLRRLTPKLFHRIMSQMQMP